MGRYQIETKKISKELEFIMKATPEKRFDNFVHRCCDFEEVWMIGNGEGFLTYDDRYVNFLVFPSEEYASAFLDFAHLLYNQPMDEADRPVRVDLEDFLDICKELKNDIKAYFWVSPNKENVHVIKPEDLFSVLLEELENY